MGYAFQFLWQKRFDLKFSRHVERSRNISSDSLVMLSVVETFLPLA